MTNAGTDKGDFQRKLDALKIDREDRPRARGGLRKVAIAVVVLIAVAGAGAYWMLRPRPVLVRTVLVEAGSRQSNGVPTVLNASGYVTARRQATVSSKITGKVVEVLVEEGMRVEKDQVLARLDASADRRRPWR